MVSVFKKTLLKRAPREYKKDYFKFFVLHLFLIILIAFSSGYLIATRVVKESYDVSMSSQNVEDGEFSTFFKFTDENIKIVEDTYDLNIEENSYYFTKFVNKNNEDNFTSIYTNRNEINKLSVSSGRLPTTLNEILLEHTYAEYNKYSIDETISIGNYQFKIVGTGFFADYPSIKKSSADIAFKYKEFLIAYVTNETFSFFSLDDVNFSYSYRFNNELSTEQKETISNDIKNTVINLANENVNFLVSFLPAINNRNIIAPNNFAQQYATIVLIFIYVLIAIISFVFSIDITSRIINEAKVIGTLRATGITRTQLVSFYLLLPLFVILVSSIIGNLLGYFVITSIFTSMFMKFFSFGLISVPFYGDIFIFTTIGPSILLFVISLLIVSIFIRKPIIKFLNGQIEHASQKGSKPLKSERKFFPRLRERIFMKNFANYLFLFLGVILGSIVFTVGVTLKTCSVNQTNIIVEEAICEDMYILKLPMECNELNTERFGMYSFEYKHDGYRDCVLTMYGICDNSKYVNIDFSNYEENTVFISSAFQEKYDIRINDELTFIDTNSGANVNYKIVGVYKYYSSVCLFAPIRVTSHLIYENRIKQSEASLQRVLDYYGISYDLKGIIVNGYFSDHKLDCFDDMYIESIITPQSLKDDVTMMLKIGDTVATLMIGFGSVVYVAIMFLLTRHLIDKNTINIALFKILGMTDKEIFESFSIPSFIVLVISLLIAMPIVSGFSYIYLAKINYKTFMEFCLYVFPPWIYFLCFGIGLASFIIVLLVSKTKVKRVSLVELYKQ